MSGDVKKQEANADREKLIRTLDHLLDWALVWNRMAGGYMASDTSLLIDRAEAFIRQSGLENTMLSHREKSEEQPHA